MVSSLKLKILQLPLVDAHFPVYLDVANAEAIVTAASCPTSSTPFGSACVAVRPGMAHLILGDVNTETFGAFNSSPMIGVATLLSASGIKVTGSVHAEIAQNNPVSLVFSSPEIAAGTVKTAMTTSFTGSLIGSLLGDPKLTVAGIGLGIIGPLINALVAPLAPILDLTIATCSKRLGFRLARPTCRVMAFAAIIACSSVKSKNPGRTKGHLAAGSNGQQDFKSTKQGWSHRRLTRVDRHKTSRSECLGPPLDNGCYQQ